MNDTQLHVFIQAADCGSFTKAAEILYLSPPAVMKQINSLESQIGIRLFHRSPRGLTLTEAGESIYKDAKAILVSCDQMICRAREIASQSPYIIRVGTSFLAPCRILMDLWKTTKNQYPQFKLQIVPFEYTTDNFLSTLEHLGDSFDFMVSPYSSVQGQNLCNFLELGQQSVSVAVPFNHPLAQKDSISLTDLHGEKLLMVKQGDSLPIDTVRNEIEKEHPEIQIKDTPYFYDFNVFNQCEEEMCAMLSLSGWSDVHPGLKSLSVDWNYKVPYGLLYPLHPSENVLYFLETLKNIL